MLDATPISPAQRQRALWLAIYALTVCVATWVIFAIVGLKLQGELALTNTQYGLLVAVPILTGSLSRLPLGIVAEIYGARRVMAVLMLVVAGFAFVLPVAKSYAVLLLLGLGLGLAGGAFAVGVVYVSAWFPPEKQGTALGLFGMGNVGTAVTSLAAPWLLASMDWQSVVGVYAKVMLASAVLFYLCTQPEPSPKKTAHTNWAGHLEPLRSFQVWSFSVYYFLVFGGFVALASWLPRFYIGVYEVDIRTAGLLAASFLIPATLFRSVGGYLSDRYGARRMMYISFSTCAVGLFFLSYPNTHYVVEGINGPIPFSIVPPMGVRAAVLAVMGMTMSLGMAAVFKHIPEYYPKHVGAVGGVVSMIGSLGGFVLPIAFGVMNDWVGIWTSCFMLMFFVAATNLLWMHFSILYMNRQRFPEIRKDKDLPELMRAALRRAKAESDAAEL
ncbi:MAG: NarK/NasA family nitrate transporter [Cellvibrionales bacterium]|nr:NarK/NasA family nitrate transporter [Cellvibrionales bacterium]